MHRGFLDRTELKCLDRKRLDFCIVRGEGSGYGAEGSDGGAEEMLDGEPQPASAAQPAASCGGEYAGATPASTAQPPWSSQPGGPRQRRRIQPAFIPSPVI